MPNGQLPDINALVYSFQADLPQHGSARAWLQGALASGEFLLPDFVLAGFVRVVTNRRTFASPATNDEAFAFVSLLRENVHTRLIVPGVRHWRRFERLCRSMDIVGSGQSDAYLAAFALEHDCELVTADRGFARYPGLKTRFPEP